MTKMTCIIVEDQPPAQRILQKFIGDVPSLELSGTFSESAPALDHMRNNPVDLIFLDIHLPKMSGLDFLKIMPEKIPVILTTAFPDYALESYEYSVVDYLLKPFSFQRFVQAIAKVPLKNENSSPEEGHTETREVFIKTGYEYVKIQLSEINFIKSDADYTEVMIGQKKLVSSESLRYWESILNPAQFFRIHKSYIVNIGKIHKVAGNQILLENEQKIPIGRAYKEAFAKNFLN